VILKTPGSSSILVNAVYITISVNTKGNVMTFVGHEPVNQTTSLIEKNKNSTQAS